MKIRTIFVILFIIISHVIFSQKKYEIGWDINGLTFNEFVRQVESRYPVKFYYNEEWVKNLKLGDYGDRRDLNEVLRSLFSGDSIYFYEGVIPGSIILTKYFAIKQSKEEPSDTLNYIPGMDFSDLSGSNAAGGNLVVDIGNPADRNKPGTVTLTGYITNQETREAIAGVAVYFPKITAGTISNGYGYYKIDIPRGSYSVRFTFIGMKEKTIDLNIYGPGELNTDLKSVLVPLKEAIISAEKDITLQRYEVGVEKLNVTSLR
jgi:hypothetical protein